jgi:hypothetical protein
MTTMTYDELRARLVASLAAKLEELDETMQGFGLRDADDRAALLRDVVREAMGDE